MLPKVSGVMRIAQEIELRYLPSGSAIAKITLVSSSKYKTQSGEEKEDTCFIEGTALGRSAEVLNQYCNKGSKIYISGDLKQDTWQDQSGQKRSKHTLKIESFEFLDSKPQQPTTGRPRAEPSAPKYDIPEVDISEDEIPFS